MEKLSEDMIDVILADSFPASDPPPWTLGRERQTDPMLAGNSSKTANAQASLPKRETLKLKVGSASLPGEVKFLEVQKGFPENFMQDMNRLSEMIRARAYELYEKRGRQDGHALEDWIRAESELLGIVLCGILESTEQLEVDASLHGVGADEIEIGVEPRRVFIGVKTKREDRKDFESTDRPIRFSLCRVCNLSCEIIPAEAIATFKDGLLRLDLPRADRR